MAFDNYGVSIPCLRSFREQYASLISGLTVADAINAVVLPLTLGPRCSLTGALKRKEAADESGAPLVGPATVYMVYADKMRLDDLLQARPAVTRPQTEAMASSHRFHPTTSAPSSPQPANRTIDDHALQAIEVHAAQQDNLDNVFVWISLFCTNYHVPPGPS